MGVSASICPCARVDRKAADEPAAFTPNLQLPRERLGQVGRRLFEADAEPPAIIKSFRSTSASTSPAVLSSSRFCCRLNRSQKEEDEGSQVSSYTTAAACLNPDEDLPPPLPESSTKNDFDTSLVRSLVMSPDREYNYDVAVIGGSSSGFTLAKELKKQGLSVALVSYFCVKEAPTFTQRFGCFPKHLVTRASEIGMEIQDAQYYGWELEGTDYHHDWTKMMMLIRTRAKKHSFQAEKSLNELNIDYFNHKAAFMNRNKLLLHDERKPDGYQRSSFTAEKIVICTGSQPRIPAEIAGAKEHAITVNQLLAMSSHPGRTLIIGGGGPALEVSGLMASLNVAVTLVYDSACANASDSMTLDHEMFAILMDSLKNHGVEMHAECKLIRIERMKCDDNQPTYRVHGTAGGKRGKAFVEEYNTVVFALDFFGRTRDLQLEKVGVTVDSRNKIQIGEDHCTNVRNIYAMGDVTSDVNQLSPGISIKSAREFVAALTGKGPVRLEPRKFVPYIVRTPIPYGWCGMTQAQAIKAFGSKGIRTFGKGFGPWEWNLPSRRTASCLTKVICNMKDDGRIVGVHYVGPRAAEVLQGFVGMMGMKATHRDLINMIGIHVTNAETLTVLENVVGTGDAADGCTT